MSNKQDDTEAEWSKYGPEYFLYGRKGPWPQPSPLHPMGEAPAVVHIPKQEMRDFNLRVGLRYIWQLLVWFPISYVQMFFRPGLLAVDDAEFESLHTNTIISKHLSPELDDADLKIFKSYMEEGKKYFISDMEPVESIDTFKNMYASGSKTLFLELSKYQYKVIAIYIYKTDVVFVPTDGDTWTLAKYYALQGTALVTTLLKHPMLHFPYDQINAVTKTAVPKHHVLFRLLSPHWRFTLPLENAVLQGSNSIIANRPWLPYTLYPGRRESVSKLLVNGYMGMKGNDSYKKFSYPLRPPKIYSTYGDFLDQYYDVIYNFVSKVLADVPKDDYYTCIWANYLSTKSPDFPNAEEIFKDDKLARVVSLYLWAVSVAHSVDHYDYGFLNVRKVPMRLRQPPPTKGVQMWERKKLTTWFDNAKYRLAQIMFYQTTTVTRLIDCDYQFGDKEKDAYTKDFFNELRALDKKMKEQNICYMPLEKMSNSVQY